MPNIKTRIRNSTPEKQRQRLLLWRLLVELLRGSHSRIFPGGKLGADMYELMVLGAVIATCLEGRTATATKIAYYMELPRETTRRTLNRLVKLGLLARFNHGYEPTEKIGSAGIEPVANLVKKTAALL